MSAGNPSELPLSREDAIADMEWARNTHLLWAAHLEAHKISGLPCSLCAERPYKMDAEHEREWVAKYDRVLALLRSGPLET